MKHVVWRWSAVVAATIALSCREVPEVDQSPARREARRLHLEGLDQVMRLNYGAAFDKLRDALMTDAGYLPALSDLWLDVAHSHRVAAVVDTAAAQAVDPGVARCLVRAAAAYRGLVPKLPPPPRHESVDARRCSFYVRYFQEQSHTRRLNPDTVRMLLDLYPESPSFANEFSSDISIAKDLTVIREAVRRSGGHDRAFSRAYLLAGLSYSLHESGNDSAALELERSVVRDPDWKFPGFRIAWAGRMTSHGSLRTLNEPGDRSHLIRHVDSMMSVVSEIRQTALGAGDPRARLSIQVGVGVEAIDRGRLDDAVQWLSASIPLVDSVGDLGWRAYVYMRLGRALVKAGRAPDAEPFLLSARRFGASAALPRVQKEVEHNLLHLYESLGQDSAALRAGEGFVRFASQGGLDPVRMMSARDVGMFLRARGRVDESRQFFGRMLADIDSLGYAVNFAGEYYELTGAVDKALAAYTLAAGRTEEPVRALAGLVRVALTMGDTAAARRWAIVHDARRDSPGRPEAPPLLPSVLRKTVGGEPARQAFESARREVANHGQVSAWALLTSDLAALENDLGEFSRAVNLADSAVEAATRVGAAEIALRARALGAYARARNTTAKGRSAVDAIAAVAAEADRSGGVLIRSEIHRMIAGALASQHRWRDALVEFRRAVDPLDSVAGRIAMDPGQAAFRSAQRRAYDEALATIVRHATSSGASDAFAAWSARRKGRTYAVQLPVESVAEIQRPARGSAIIDYVFLDTQLAALVVTANAATIVPLDVSPKQVRFDAGELRRAVDLRVGSSLDLSRALFPLSVAHRLYQNLLEPLEPHLAGARTLVIVPDGILSLVPFDALVTSMPQNASDFSRARYVLDDRVVVNATTVRTEPSAWRVMTRRLTMIDPGTVPDAPREVEAVVDALPLAVVTSLRGGQATRARTIAAMTAADVVHFVAHAEANEHDPGSSRIELAADGGDDGRLGASEVAALRLDAPLVFLSACETANGRVLDGEGVLSLSRSFLRAGARATVATLWPVGPSAADFAEAFYANVVRSGDAAEALRSAKLLLRERGVPPTTWAAYQLSAAPTPRGRASAIVAARD